MQSLDELTPRQLEILALMASGFSGPEIARQLFLSIHTVRNYLKLSKKKTGARNIPQLICWLTAYEMIELKSNTKVYVKGNKI